MFYAGVTGNRVDTGLTSGGGVFNRCGSSEGPDWFRVVKALLDLRPVPTLLMKADLTVYLRNEAAALAAEALCAYRNGVLQFVAACRDSRFKSAVESLRRGTETESAAVLRLEQKDGTPFILSMAPLRHLGSGIEGASSRDLWLVVSVRENLRRGDVHPACLTSAFGLTPAEANLATAIAEGLSLQDYAARESIKISTVRWHLQNIFCRTGARSQTELVTMVASLTDVMHR